MIADWRAQWFNYTGGLTDPLFPFGFVMLSTWNDVANTTCGNNPPDTCVVAIVRWGQTARLVVCSVARCDDVLAVTASCRTLRCPTRS